jgi:hypothetical protein
VNTPRGCARWSILVGLALLALALVLGSAAHAAGELEDAGTPDAGTSDAALPQAALPPSLAPATVVPTEAPPPASLVATPAPAETPLVRRWWFWTGIGAVVVGGVVAALLLTHSSGRPDCPVAMGYECP